MPQSILALDQGTTSSRAIVFGHDGRPRGVSQQEFPQIYPSPGHVEHDPEAIWQSQLATAKGALANAKVAATDIAAIGVTNQRETTIVWDRRTGRPLHNAIVWQDTRTDAIAAALDRDGRGDVIRHRAGLPPATYFSGGKLQWILENVPGVREKAERGDALFGTADTWVLWNLTGGVDGGVHVTDVTNASRTMLMDLETLQWDDELLGFFGIPRAMLPEIRESSATTPYGTTRRNGPFGGEVPITGILGDQQAATVGQVCFAMSKPQDVSPPVDGYTQAYLYLTNRPAEGVSNEVNLVAGFNFAPDQPATLTVGGTKFDLFTQKDAAWLLDASQNDNLAGALRAGSTVTIEGTTERGILVTETFSLSGATAASRAIGGC